MRAGYFSFNDKCGVVERGHVGGGDDEAHVQLVPRHGVQRLQGDHMEHLVHRVVRAHHADVLDHALREVEKLPRSETGCAFCIINL